MKSKRLTKKRFENFLNFLKETGKIQDFRVERTFLKDYKIEIRMENNWHKFLALDLKEGLKIIVSNLF